MNLGKHLMQIAKKTAQKNNEPSLALFFFTAL